MIILPQRPRSVKDYFLSLFVFSPGRGKIFSLGVRKPANFAPGGAYTGMYCFSAARRQISHKEEISMDEHKPLLPHLPQEPGPRDDLDDLIFRGEGWLASDR